MRVSVRVIAVVWCVAGLLVGATTASARQDQAVPPAAAEATGSKDEQSTQPPPGREYVFDLGEIVVVGTEPGMPGIGGSALTQEEMWTFDRKALDEAVNIVPGVVSTFDSNGRRNESDIFVRGFGRWQVPLMLDGVRIYLPADNRLDFSRFLTADIATIQIQKGYASVLDGPGAMGGAINLVTRKPSRTFEAEGSVSTGGRSESEGWDGYVMLGTRQPRYYLQGSVNYADRDFWTLSGDYQPTPTSLQADGRRLGSDTEDSRLNLKAAITPNDTDEYTFNYIKQTGEKGAPLNVYNNPPVPGNSFWRWPYWDVQNTSFLSRTQLGDVSYLKTKLYYNTFENGLDAYDDGTYTTQSSGRAFHSPYDDHAYGVDFEVGTTQGSANTLKTAAHYRKDFHSEQNLSRPTNPALSVLDPVQDQSQYTWSVAVEDTFHATPDVDIIGGVSYDRYAITKAEEFDDDVSDSVFEYPRGGSDAFNWQGAVIWRYSQAGQVHASVSDRARFPVIFELYSTRFGTATPNPNLGPERATNLEVGWRTSAGRNVQLEGAVFYSDVRDLIQTVVLPDTTTQTQNVGDGRFYGAEIAVEAPVSSHLTVGGNYTAINRTINDALQPDLRPTGVPTHKAFLYAAWQPIARLTITPSLDVAGDRWSDVNPAPEFPYVRTGAYTLVSVAGEYALASNIAVVLGFKNLTDDNYELAWGFPREGRTFYVKTRMGL